MHDYRSDALLNVSYEIRGPVLREAQRLEKAGQDILKLNIGNPAPFGFQAPASILRDVTDHLGSAAGYCDAKGLTEARRALLEHYRGRAVEGITAEDIYVGNGVSELIVMTLQGLLNPDDEILIPAPDYPLWTAATNLTGARPIHYIKDEQANWQPDLDDMRKKITAKTRAIVIINPNNPTGAVYSRDVLEAVVALARTHGLLLFCDEIYDRIVYDGAEHITLASLAGDVPCLTFSGLSKAWRVAGFRCGWMVFSGCKKRTRLYRQGLETLASMRLCANVPAQYAVAGALSCENSIDTLVLPKGRLFEQRKVVWERLTAIAGVSCVKPQGAFYLFPKLDRRLYRIDSDEQLVLQLLREEQLLLVHGTGFNWPSADHVRFVALPDVAVLHEALDRFERFLGRLGGRRSVSKSV